MRTQVMAHPEAINCLLPMGITSENVAEKYGISKEKQNRLVRKPTCPQLAGVAVVSAQACSSFQHMSAASTELCRKRVRRERTCRSCHMSLAPARLVVDGAVRRLDYSKQSPVRYAQAFMSHEKALAAVANGTFKDEIVPVTTKEGVVIDTDEGATQPGMSRRSP